MITVLITVTFLMVLLTILLTVSTVNLQIKQMEYRTKKNFYQNEQILSEIYHGIGKEAGECFSKAYASILSQTSGNGKKPVYQSEEEAFAAFSRNFMNRLAKKFPEGRPEEDTLTLLNKYSLYAKSETKVKSYKGIEIVRDEKGVPIQLAINGIVVSYMENDGSGQPTGYESAITTDIVIDIPYVTFFENPAQILDYALIGNKGVYFNGGSRSVAGSIYAGADKEEPAANLAVYRNEDVYGGLNFYNTEAEIFAKHMISRGDITIRKSRLNVAMDADSQDLAQIWAETVRTVEDKDRSRQAEGSEVLLWGRIFLANDLELNARESQVTLKGEYYGYNSGIYETQEKRSLSDAYASSAHTQSSAVIINGSQSKLDLSELTTFVTVGTAYIDLANSNFPEGGAAGIEEYATGESLSLKSNQYIYLAPEGCLTVANPSVEDIADAAVWVEGYDFFAYNKGYIHADEPVVKRIYGRNGKKFTYYYLNFISGDKKKEYTELVLNMVEPEKMESDMSDGLRAMYAGLDELELQQIWEIKQAAQARVAAGGIAAIVDKTDKKAAHIYAKGAIVQAENGGEYAIIPEEDRRLSLDYVSMVENNLFKHYQYFCTSLDAKEDFSLLSEGLPMVPPEDMEDSTRPFSVYIDLHPLASAREEGVYKCTGKYGACRTMISRSDLRITENISGIIICNGDVTVENGVNVEGLIMAAGRIYVEGNGRIDASRSIIQAILDEEYEAEIIKERGEAKNPSYASTYLRHYTPERRGAEHAQRITGTDYTDYISYRNWRKGEGN